MKNLPRWVFSSLASHFKTIADNNSIPFFVEGIDERESEDMRQSHVEFRITGPMVKEVSKEYYTVEVVVNALFTSLMELTGVNAYQIVNWCGVFAEEMHKPLPIYKYGDGPDDDGSLVGCLRVKKDAKDAVRVWHFGQISTVDRVRQSEVDATYEMDVTSEDF
jgi:hypothetical protein